MASGGTCLESDAIDNFCESLRRHTTKRLFPNPHKILVLDTQGNHDHWTFSSLINTTASAHEFANMSPLNCPPLVFAQNYNNLHWYTVLLRQDDNDETIMHCYIYDTKVTGPSVSGRHNMQHPEPHLVDKCALLQQWRRELNTGTCTDLHVHVLNVGELWFGSNTQIQTNLDCGVWCCYLIQHLSEHPDDVWLERCPKCRGDQMTPNRSILARMTTDKYEPLTCHATVSPTPTTTPPMSPTASTPSPTKKRKGSPSSASAASSKRKKKPLYPQNPSEILDLTSNRTLYVPMSFSAEFFKHMNKTIKVGTRRVVMGEYILGDDLYSLLKNHRKNIRKGSSFRHTEIPQTVAPPRDAPWYDRPDFTDTERSWIRNITQGRIFSSVVFEKPATPLPPGDHSVNTTLELDGLFRAVFHEYPVSELLTGNVSNKDTKRLQHGEWLNDEIVNSCMGLLNERSLRMGKKHMFMNSFLMDKTTFKEKQIRWFKRAQMILNGASSTSASSVTNYTFRFDGIERIVIPINIDNTHWISIHVDVPNRKIEVLDSYHGDHTDRAISVINLLIEMWKLDKGWGGLSWGIYHRKDLPVQTDGNSCGVFTCAYAVMLTGEDDHNPDRNGRGWNFDQSNMSYFRNRLAVDIGRRWIS